MSEYIIRLSKNLVISRRHKNVRQGVLVLLSNLLIGAAALFALNITLIFLGVGDVFLPLTSEFQHLLARLAF
ncbi:MAG: hypothetical protein GF398_21700 [Chitinivibrionales bacterium]|nr:hypothetical protein [Chitinivibrionales bacterium]